MPAAEAGDGLRRTGGAVDLAFRVAGAGPAVVLLHGTSASHAVWQGVVDALDGRALTIAVDQRGHGRSDRPAAGYGGRDFAGDVIAVLDAMGIDRAIVAGHSLGARNAWLAGAWHRDRVRGVLAIDYTPFVAASVLDELAVRVAAGDRAFADVAEIESYLAARYPRMPEDAVRRRAEWGYRRAAGDGWRPLADPAAMRQLIDGLRVPWEEEFRAVPVPMVHVRGADSRIVDAAAWQRALAARPGDRWVVATGADHYVPEEDPALVATELERLLTTFHDEEES